MMIRSIFATILSVSMAGVALTPAQAASKKSEAKEGKTTATPDGRRKPVRDAHDTETSVDSGGERGHDVGEYDPNRGHPTADELHRQIAEGKITAATWHRLQNLRGVLTDKNYTFEIVGTLAALTLMERIRMLLSTGGLARMTLRRVPALALMPPEMFEAMMADPNRYYIPGHAKYKISDIVLALSLPPDEQGPDSKPGSGRDTLSLSLPPDEQGPDSKPGSGRDTLSLSLPPNEQNPEDVVKRSKNDKFIKYLIQVLLSVESQNSLRYADQA